MACDRIAVVTAEVNYDLERHLLNANNRARLYEFLKSKGLSYRGVRVSGGGVILTSSAPYAAKTAVAVKQWATMENQLRILSIVKSAGATITGTAMDAQGGMAFSAEYRGIKYSIHVDTDGKLTFGTDSGTFEQGKALIMATLQVLRANGINISNVGKIETHNHSVQADTVYSANSCKLSVNSTPGEDGWHTH